MGHDGSIRHLKKYRDEWGWNKLKENGFLVYSTCSLSIKQNENVIKYLLEMFESASIVSITQNEALKGFDFVNGKLMNEKDKNTRFDTSKCIRFDPFTSKTSGLFIAKILKSKK